MISTAVSFTGSDNAVFQIQLVSELEYSNSVFVSVTPVTTPIVQQHYPTGRIAPARVASRDQRVSFGKHKGRTYAEVALEEPGYLKWMLREGAGSVIERQCATLALDLGIDHLPPDPAASRIRIQPPSDSWSSASEIPIAKSPLALPDPDRKRGVLNAIRGWLR